MVASSPAWESEFLIPQQTAGGFNVPLVAVERPVARLRTVFLSCRSSVVCGWAFSSTIVLEAATLGDRNQRYSPVQGTWGRYFARSSSGITSWRKKASSSASCTGDIRFSRYVAYPYFI
jgi:hypothetical protein